MAADAEQRTVAVSGCAVLKRDARPVRAGVLEHLHCVAVCDLCGHNGKRGGAAVQGMCIALLRCESRQGGGAEQKRRRKAAQVHHKFCFDPSVHGDSLRSLYYIQYYFTGIFVPGQLFSVFFCEKSAAFHTVLRDVAKKLLAGRLDRWYTEAYCENAAHRQAARRAVQKRGTKIGEKILCGACGPRDGHI